MSKKLKPKAENFILIAKDNISPHIGKIEIPEGATDMEVDMDYSGCYYEGDTPWINVSFYRKAEDTEVGRD